MAFPGKNIENLHKKLDKPDNPPNKTVEFVS